MTTNTMGTNMMPKPDCATIRVVNNHYHWVWDKHENCYAMKKGMPRASETHPNVQDEVVVNIVWQIAFSRTDLHSRTDLYPRSGS